ncbi:HAD family hydrolase [Synechococcus elongatus]|uniref:Sucrose phosphatase-like domain-containing protein n=1 Tax=Synechococcus sp. (strain ATCC 27144 / PCC 6301 / SAUG 1402/1) TaxID=269084 RepID=A0A0H3K2D9_SYNP6|nr:HAD family hydrolase [Synechococcus elongatus]AJD56361.1 HAD family hydrolase [Synechococcus elongatus UTEX 2973]UOW70357.1 HAD family hydrolase [Synechococcus elongatus PCC 7943]UOW73078.1 HAD family hydrolase [Synechococcus elongatus PCC 6311]UOW75799.1 HAD family hydrolase [Synechococcus elongatus PCC 6301]WKW06149.1 HAD family hydrolase [Synechococcus elongatus PCC 7942 = FACHB-805]
MISFQVPQAIQQANLSAVRLIVSDLDGTLTASDRLSAALIEAFEQLAAAEIRVLISTGRSVGWGMALAQYLPVAGVMTENGGAICWPEQAPIILSPIAAIADHRQQLQQCFQQIQQHWPQLQAAADNAFRQTDWAFDVTGLTEADLTQIAAIAMGQGLDFVYSAVQCHLLPRGQSKGRSLWQVCQSTFPALQPEQIVTVGDSPNDASLFAEFPLSVGVANLVPYLHRLPQPPRYLCQQPEVAGFLELVEVLLRDRA